MRKLVEAAGTVRVHLEASDEVQSCINDIMQLAFRYENALKFYSNRDNYIDGVPMQRAPEDGLLSESDEGSIARHALGQDYSLGLVLRLPAKAA